MREPKQCLQRDKRTGRVRVFAVFNGVRRYYQGAAGSPQIAAQHQQLVNEWKAGGCKAPPRPINERRGDGLTVTEMIAAFMPAAFARWGAKSQWAHVKGVLRLLEQTFGNVQAADLGGREMLALQTAMNLGDEDADRERYTPSTIKDRMSYIRQALAWAVGFLHLSSDVLARTSIDVVPNLTSRSPGVKPPRQRVWPTDAEIDAVLPHASRQVAAMIQLQRETGARPSELFGLRPCDIDRSEQPWCVTFPEHKTAHRGKSRELDFWPPAQAILLPFLSDRAPLAPCFSPKEAWLDRVAGKPRSGPRSPGDRYDKDSYAQAVQRGCERAGLGERRFTPYGLRRFALDGIDRQQGKIAAKLAGGHANSGTTEEHYLKGEGDRARRREVFRKWQSRNGGPAGEGTAS